MLSPQEALLFQAVKEEQANQQAADLLTGGGAIGGALAGVGIGAVPHGLGEALNTLKGTRKRGVARTLRPGWRMAGGLTGMILGGGLGAGTAALMKESPAARLLGKIQAQGGQVDEVDKIALANMLGDIYENPSQLM